MAREPHSCLRMAADNHLYTLQNIVTYNAEEISHRLWARAAFVMIMELIFLHDHGHRVERAALSGVVRGARTRSCAEEKEIGVGNVSQGILVARSHNPMRYLDWVEVIELLRKADRGVALF